MSGAPIPASKAILTAVALLRAQYARELDALITDEAASRGMDVATMALDLEAGLWVPRTAPDPREDG